MMETIETTTEPVVLLTDEPMGYDPRHLSADTLGLKLRMSAPGTTEQRALLAEQRRRWTAEQARRQRLGADAHA